MSALNFELDAQIVAEKTSNPVWADTKLPFKYYSAFYSGKKVMEEFFAEQQKVVEELLDEDPSRSNRKEDCSMIDVGCGTCEVGSALYNTVKHSLNCDFNPEFFRLTVELHPECLKADNFHFLLGDAMQLEDLISNSAGAGFDVDDLYKTRRVCTMLTNTFGILPTEIRNPIIRQMVKVAGPDGVSVISCFHSGSFRRGIEEFYKMSPEMCGELTDDMCDFDNAVFLNPNTGYTSQWWSEERLRAECGDVEGIDIKVEVRGPGIFLILRQKSGSESTGSQ